MRIARLLLADSSAPIVAIERRGVLYDVAELDRHLETRWAPERLDAASDFRTRVLSLGGAGLAALDAALAAGHRARDARILPGTWVWLPPCETDGLVVELDPADAPQSADGRGFGVGTARTLLGHDAAVPMPAGEEEPDVELSLAAVLGEDVARADATEADAAVAGYSILARWVGRSTARRLSSGPRERVGAAQLGPFLLTHDEGPALAAGAGSISVAGRRLAVGPLATSLAKLAEGIAFVSRWIPLRAGDVVAGGRLPGGSASGHGVALEWGAAVELELDGLGRLAGRPVRGAY